MNPTDASPSPSTSDTSERKRRTRSALKTYDAEKTTTAKKVIQELSVKAKPKALPLRELIQSIKPEIEAARKANYSLEDIASALKSIEIEVTANALRRYLRKPKAAKPKAKSA